MYQMYLTTKSMKATQASFLFFILMYQTSYFLIVIYFVY